jgi:hypothetical protein
MTGIVDFRTQLLDETGAPIDGANPLPVTGGGGGGGDLLSDTVFKDSTGQLFVYRDEGTGVPDAFEIPGWTLYTPIGAVTSASSGNTAASATGSAVPADAGYVGFNVDGNLVGVSEAAPLPVADNASGNLLRRILQMLMAPLGYDKSIQRNRVTALIESGTVTTVTNVTTVGALNNIDGYNARMQILDNNRTSWALNVRSRIT